MNILYQDGLFIIDRVELAKIIGVPHSVCVGCDCFIEIEIHSNKTEDCGGILFSAFKKNLIKKFKDLPEVVRVFSRDKNIEVEFDTSVELT